MDEKFTNFRYSLPADLARKIGRLSLTTGRSKAVIARKALFTFFNLTEPLQLSALENIELIHGRNFIVPRRFTKNSNPYHAVRTTVRMKIAEADKLYAQISHLALVAYPRYNVRLSVMAITRCAIVHSLNF